VDIKELIWCKLALKRYRKRNNKTFKVHSALITKSTETLGRQSKTKEIVTIISADQLEHIVLFCSIIMHMQLYALQCTMHKDRSATILVTCYMRCGHKEVWADNDNVFIGRCLL